MKLESLKSSKFEAFKGNELLNIVNVIGGQKYRTMHHSATFNDCWTDSTGDDHKCTDGTSYDNCLVVPDGESGTLTECTTTDGDIWSIAACLDCPPE